MDSIETLIHFCNTSKPDDLYRVTTEYILSNLDKLPNASIYDMADICFTSTSTISRLVKKLGFESYVDLKAKIVYALENHRYLNRNTRDIELVDDKDIVDLYFNFLINNILDLKSMVSYEMVRNISDHLWEAEEVILFGTPNVPLNNIQKFMVLSNKKTQYIEVSATENAIKTIKLPKASCKSVLYSLTPDLREMAGSRSFLKQAHTNGYYVINVCSGIRNEFAEFSDLQITFDGTKTSMDLYLYMIVNNLVQYDYGNRYLNKIMDRFV